MSNSTNLTLPFLTLGQAQKHVTVNESLLRLDALVQLAVVSATTTAEPGSPSDGQVYIIPAGKTGTHWSAMANNALAYYRDGVWEEISPREGFFAYVKDVDQLRTYNGSSWALFSAAVNFAATDKVLGRVSSGAGAAEEVTFTDQAQQLCDDTSFGAMRPTLGAAGLADANTFANAQIVQVASGTPLTLQLDDNGAAIGPLLVRFTGRDSAGNNTSFGAVRCDITDVTDGTEDAELRFFAIVNGSVANDRMRIGGGVYHSSRHAATKATTPSISVRCMTTTRCSLASCSNMRAPARWISISGTARRRAAITPRRIASGISASCSMSTPMPPIGRNGAICPACPDREEWAEHARDKKPVGEMISRLWQTVEMLHAQLRDRIETLKN